MEKKAALIATMPKSGTWYINCFMWLYAELMRTPDRYITKNPITHKKIPQIQKAIRRHEKAKQFAENLQSQNLLKFLYHKLLHEPSILNRRLGFDANLKINRIFSTLDSILVVQAECPGFREYIHDEHRVMWDALSYRSNGYTIGNSAEQIEQIDPSSQSKVVYCYRNPLDQMLSFYRHRSQHKNPLERSICDHDGNIIRPIHDLQDFIFEAGALDSFIKQYYTYKAMHEKFPHTILLISYEQLIRDPHRSFQSILKHLSIEPFSTKTEKIFKIAIEETTIDKMREVENKLGRISSHHPISKHERRIRNGKPGAWVDHYSDADVQRIDNRLNDFGISLNHFDLGYI